MKAFGEVKEGNVVTLDFVDGATVVTLNGAAKGTIPGEPFNRALTKIWLGDKPVQADLKKAMLAAYSRGMPDFWPSCGYRLLAVGADGRLRLTDDFLRSLLLRPELAPIPESCAAERALHEKLIASPRLAVAADELGAVSDADARENYGIWSSAFASGSPPRRASRRPTSRCFAKASTCRRFSSIS